EQAERAGDALRVLLDHEWLQVVGQVEYHLPPLIKDLVQARPEGNDPEQVRLAHRLAAAWYRERFAAGSARHAPPPSLDDFRLLLEALWHTCQAGQPAAAAQLMQAEQLFLYLNRWGGQRLLLELYQQLLPAEQWNASPLLAGRLYHEMGVIQ